MAQTIEEMVHAARRMIEARRSRSISPLRVAPPAAPTLTRQQDVALQIINAGRRLKGLGPLEALTDRGPEQPRAEKIDSAKLAGEIIWAGEIARGRIPPPLPPKGSLAFQILRAGAIARNEPFPE
jgi:hypothetical protein